MGDMVTASFCITHFLQLNKYMNLQKMAEKNLKKLTPQLPECFSITGSVSAFSASIDYLNTQPINGYVDHMESTSPNNWVWQARRQAYKNLDPICQICRKYKGKQLHHVNYSGKLGREQYHECQWVCGLCHSEDPHTIAAKRRNESTSSVSPTTPNIDPLEKVKQDLIRRMMDM
jgi:hypothetical protein